MRPARTRPRTPASSTDRVGDAIGVGAAIIGTVAVHLALFGGDRYFPLRFLLFPLDNVIAFSAFWISVTLLVIAIVRVHRARAWTILSPDGATTGAGAGAGADARAGAGAGGAGADARARARAYDGVPGTVTRRAMRAAAIVAGLNALFMIVFVIGAVVAFVVIFVIAAALIAGVYIVLRAVAPSAR